MIIHYNNQRVLHLVYQQIYHKIIKYIDVRLYFIRDLVEFGSHL